MADVDEIWLEMQREQPGAARRKVKGGLDLSSLQKERPKAKKAGAKKQLDSSLHWMQSWSASLKTEQQDFGATALAGADGAAMSMVEPPTTLIDAVEELPTGTPETFLAYLQRDVNCLAEDSLSVRLQSIQKLERILVQQADGLSTDIVDAVCDALLKPLLKRMKDKSEKCRELAVKILQSLVENTSDLAATLPYVFPTLVARLGCEDLDGVAHLPEVMRPDPEQKPLELARPVEESEEVRLCLGRFVASLLSRCSPTQVYSYVDECTGLIRAQAMDPYHEVKALACETMVAFCYNHREMLLHFALPLARSLTSCLTHNHAKIRIAAMRAVTACLFCGVWKHNFEIFQILMAWQDPNKVPIKAFFEGVTNVNYMSTLSFDRHPAVRRFWFETMGYWLLRCVDKVDLEPYIVPYILTGLCDENEEIALEVFWLIEKVGEAYEEEHESDLRKTKQYGFDYGWTYEGRASVPFPLQGVWGGGGSVSSHVRRTGARGPDFLGEKALGEHKYREQLDAEIAEGEDVELEEEDEATRKLGKPLPLPTRDYCWGDFRDMKVFRRLPRPRLGSRCWVRTHARRFIKATFNDVVDFRDCTANNAGRLLCMSIAYTEEGVTEWLQPMTAALTKFYSGRAWAAGDSKVMETYSTVCKLLGAFLEPISLWTQLKTALDPDSLLDLDQRVASVRILSMCLQGHIETLQSISPPDPSVGLGHLEEVIPELISMMHESDLLLSPTPESREALWLLLFSFLEPLRPQLSEGQISQLLFVALALAAKPPSDQASELPVTGPSSKAKAARAAADQLQLLDLEEEELLDPEKLNRALEALSQGLEETVTAATPGKMQALPSYSLDSMEDDDFVASPCEVVESDPRSLHQLLFERAFMEVMERSDDSFQVFRSVLYLSPLAVLVKADHQDVVFQRLASFVASTASQPTRCAAHTLGVQLAHRCAKLLESLPTGSSLAPLARNFIWKVFQLAGRAQSEAMTGKCQSLSFAVIMTSLSQWRGFFLQSCVDPRLALFPSVQQEVSSEPLAWMVSCFADQELYKRFHLAMEHAEVVLTGRSRDDFVVEKARQFRLESERRSNIARAMSMSTLLLGLRRMLLDGRSSSLPWQPGSAAGSTRGLFLAVASMFSTAEPTMDPPFVRPSPPGLIIYAAEILHLLLHVEQVEAAASAFRLLDDAARAIHQLPVPKSKPCLPQGMRLSTEEEEQLVANFIGAMLELNLTLPPDPQAKHAPASLDQGSGDIVLGWDDSLLPASSGDDGRIAAASSRESSAVPAEVTRLLAQSSECQRWNAALALYTLGVDLSEVFQDAFHANIARWKKRKEQAKVLLAQDVLQRGKKTLSALT
eukprot:gb/GFBE01081535.1/.p1 GENE.gb/GFBE01081535.1/~~gb/GFBE01081535.1/.p1  ORF type:complete len:1342 (+),score=336.29 gb/GFBE01081535.1/:1-4026(+)